MICSIKCPKKLKDCKPLSNIVSDCKTTFVCVGLSKKESRTVEQDKFRHCFRSATTDSLFDYDLYDLKSVISVMAEAVLLDEIVDLH